jgi:hypothetical protein
MRRIEFPNIHSAQGARVSLKHRYAGAPDSLFAVLANLANEDVMAQTGFQIDLREHRPMNKNFRRMRAQ